MTFPTQKFNTLQTPFYYYDTSLLQQTLDAIAKATAEDSNYHIHYAIKANANPLLLKFISAAGLGADCVSGGEIQVALQNGFPATQIVFAGVGKSDAEIDIALNAGIRCFNVESLPELEVINERAGALGKVANVAFRINPNVDAHTHAKITTGLNENKFGIDMDDMVPAIRRAQELPHTQYVGLHFHIGSQILEFGCFEALCERINELQTKLEEAGIVTPSINVGGGLGIDYQQPDANPIPNFNGYFNTFRRCLKLRQGQELHFELGRSVVAQCGALISRVLYVKRGKTKQFAIVDAGFTDLIRPAMYGSYHEADNLSAAPNAPIETYDVVGPICESSDVFLKDYQMPSTQRGHLIAFRSAGAYGEVMASQYNCRPLPASFAE